MGPCRGLRWSYSEGGWAGFPPARGVGFCSAEGRDESDLSLLQTVFPLENPILGAVDLDPSGCGSLIEVPIGGREHGVPPTLMWFSVPETDLGEKDYFGPLPGALERATWRSTGGVFRPRARVDFVCCEGRDGVSVLSRKPVF